MTRVLVRSMLLKRLKHVGFSHYCPCCRTPVRHFVEFHGRPHARCPVCGSLERHRLMVRYLRQRTDLFDGGKKRLLHCAPEPYFSRLFRRLTNVSYVSLDLQVHPGNSLSADLTRLPFRDGAFDVIYCSHVLEHIPDDRAAMRELGRVLRRGGWAILQSPIEYMDRPTFEDWTVTTPEARLEIFGQEDHVRCYGTDYVSRLEESGFAVTTDRFAREQTASDVHRLGLLADEDIFVCRHATAVSR